jgi:NTP pyrophosphatase (non-canonical NTP hydrolase)
MTTQSDSLTIEELALLVREFAADREWDQFHSLRNLVLALVGEVGELAAELQWVPDSDVQQLLTDPIQKKAVASELADIFSYLLRLADIADISLEAELKDKILLNQTRYPSDKARGSAKKYTAYE